MDYTTIIGLEVHVQLQTLTKAFCGCSTAFNPLAPNTQTCPVCIGMPGTLPVLNKTAFELAVKSALALNCEIARYTKWDRKQYYYPDLPKGYQISQYDLPFSRDGYVDVPSETADGGVRRVGIIRVHLEEDAGKNMHDETGRGRDSQIDLNRAGTPLVEIVSQPDLRSAAEAKCYLEELRLLLTYLQVSDCNMQEGSLRCDANVNLHVHLPDGRRVATPIVEIKNLNSFRNVEMAIEYEVQRQLAEYHLTGHTIKDVAKETRGWDAAAGVTKTQRGKEEAADYRYFPDPDLVPVTVSDDWLEAVRASLCEFPNDRRARLAVTYQLSDYDCRVIVDQGEPFARYFEEAAQACGDGKTAANWLTQDVQRELNDRKLTVDRFPISSAVLGNLLGRIQKQQITTKSAREVFTDLLGEWDKATETDSPPPALDVARVEAIIAAKNLTINNDTGALDAAIAAVLAKNPKIIADFQSGKQGAIGPLIGQVMKDVKGASPQTVREMIVAKLSQ